MQTLTKSWWLKNKSNYVFDPKWFEAFASQDPRLTLPQEPGKMGVVFWHEPDGQTILPVGIIFKDGEDCLFCYHPDYVDSPDTKPISLSLPKRKEPFLYNNDHLMVFYFDNLVAEGWLGLLQRNACHKASGANDVVNSVKDFELDDDGDERFRRLLAFGRGFHGAVSVVDVALPDKVLRQEEDDVHNSLLSGASVGGAQPKILAIKRGNHFHVAERDDISTHIAKLRQDTKYPQILQNEYLNILATRALLPQDETVEAEMGAMEVTPGNIDIALFIKRFDRTSQEGRIHFEEALQILHKPSAMKYDFSYRDLAEVARPLVGDEGVRRIFKRVLAQFLMGNSDGHFKNFAFWQKNGGWDLTPNYDLVTDEGFKATDPDYDLKTPLFIHGRKYDIRGLNPQRLLELGEEFGLNATQVKAAVDELRARIAEVKRNIMEDSEPLVEEAHKRKFCEEMDTRVEHMFGSFDRYIDLDPPSLGGSPKR
jgi:serine/threonine-protein kinase HipA